MAFNIISAAEAATYIKHGYNVGLSGFTPAGSPKAVTPEIAKIAEAEHAAGRPFQSVSLPVHLPATLPTVHLSVLRLSAIVLLILPMPISVRL